MTGTIDPLALHEHRAKLVMTALRGVCVATPLFVVTLWSWTPTLFILALISGAVMLAAGWSSYRGVRELRLPLRERFMLQNDTLVRFVDGREVARIRRREVRTLFMDRAALSVAAKGRQIVIPTATADFVEFEATLRLWGPIHTRTSMFTNLPDRMLTQVVLRTLLLVVALAYVGWVTGVWQHAAIGILAGVVLAEALGRWFVSRSRARLPDARA